MLSNRGDPAIRIKSFTDFTPEMNTTEYLNFVNANSEAGQFVGLATDDYVACRCCLLNGVFTGFRLGAEAVEKYIKAFILYKEPSHPVKDYWHDIKKVASVASSLEPSFSPVQPFRDIINQLELHYRLRYPRVPHPPYGASTGDGVRPCNWRHFIEI